ncbi:ATP-binding protein [Streptomyces acidiscabies]|uniref:ATP-binding protein n=1 Tax=Streptomyces acidiscabies TaxID=42234 RepID=UPI001C4B371A|nr:ATP-binding protein [Streptomyces acidiscabies]
MGLLTVEYGNGTAQLAAVLAGGVVVAAVVGVRRARAAAVALRQVGDAELQLIVDAANAAEQTAIWTAEQLCQGKRPPLPEEPQPIGQGMVRQTLSVIGNLQVQGAGALIRVHDESQAALLMEMHRTLTRRLHALIDASLEHLTLLQDKLEDPELLDQSFKIDHLITRARRLVESISVILGGQSLRETREPMDASTVLSGAVCEVVEYARVRTAAGEAGTSVALPQHVHPDVTHLLAELIDNGLDHTDPAQEVVVRASVVARGLLIEVEDQAMLPMSDAQRVLLNRLLDRPDEVDVAAQVRYGQLGLITVAKISQRYGLKVWLVPNPIGGTTANVLIPHEYLVEVSPHLGTVHVAPRPVLVREAVTRGPGPSARVDHPQQSGAGRLPKRQRVVRPVPETPIVPEPVQTAAPATLADWRAGIRRALDASDTPDLISSPPHTERT